MKKYSLCIALFASLLFTGKASSSLFKKDVPTHRKSAEMPDDSLPRFRHVNNILFNVFSLFNQELAFAYQRETKEHFSISIPVAVGFGKPFITQLMDYDFSEYEYVHYSTYQIHKKLFEVGLGLNYYPSKRQEANYYIGPVFKYAQYIGNQNYDNVIIDTSGITHIYVSQNVTLSRYQIGLTNGCIFRTGPRFTMQLYATVGYKKDVFLNPIISLVSHTKTAPHHIINGVFVWLGFNLGYSF